MYDTRFYFLRFSSAEGRGGEEERKRDGSHQFGIPKSRLKTGFSFCSLNPATRGSRIQRKKFYSGTPRAKR